MFIGKYKIDSKICNELIEYFHRNEQLHVPGIIDSQNPRIDKDAKASTDLKCFDALDPILNIYINALQKCLEKYMEEYPESTYQQNTFSISVSPNIQMYKPGEGFKKYHYERNGSLATNNRHLVFMTYLNTVKDGGGTEFKYQKKKFKAVKGDTLIWPADWTHTHRGIVSKKYTKYIITGWYYYIHENY